MARLLVKLISATSLNVDKDILLYKRGDVVKVAPDGYYFGNRIEGNRNPKFGIIDLPGVPPARLLSLVEMETEATAQKDEVRMVRRRLRRVNLNSLTAGELGDLEGSERKVELTEARLTALTEVKA
jgi:hypothetical protein